MCDLIWVVHTQMPKSYRFFVKFSYNQQTPVFHGAYHIKGSQKMQIAQLHTFGFQVVPVKEFNPSTSVEFDGSLEKFVYTAAGKRPTMLFMKGKTVGEILLQIIKDNNFHGYTADMAYDLLESMLYLSNLQTHPLELPKSAIEEIKYLKTRPSMQAEIIEYQLALPVDSILLKSPLYKHTWIEYFQTHFYDIATHECRSRVARISQHNAHLKQKPNTTLMPLAECA